MSFDTRIYRGSRESVNPEMYVTYHYTFTAEGNYTTIREKSSGGYVVDPSYAISISEGFDKPNIFLPGIKYYSFVTLFDKSVKMISDNLFTIFPNVNRTEFDIDSKALERFQTEKALTTAGMTAVPSVWVNSTSECFPGIRISSKHGSVTIPLEDAIPLVEMFKRFDPIVYSISMLRFFGKIED